MPSEEHQLIAKAQQGDRTALNLLISRYWQPVYRLAYYKTGNQDDAQEIAQDTFLKVFGALSRYKHMEASFKTYLSRITINLVNDYWRKKGRVPPIIDIDAYKEPLFDPAAKPEDQALGSERREEIAALIAMLPAEQRRVVELRIIESLSVAETALIINKTEAAVKMLQQRALKKLRQLFVERDIDMVH
ncbi:MAG TPA: RNA polymerase sigma factor [Methylomusa anaerophila]|uniref:RNA polymerase sigma factor n=1 Tax=Methylomusa anaerophila TaxID=1930071 RepID=A0A348AK91_9FIRM|nr:RNA polymerase sigma factor [Methylomusa anaerophila]BBB91489.1 ECF RNA polymerase sigma-E factor [Methylomusa anaerophila]HML89922.1 RNA polymerase sigma factor [Methylomusa anaerophila]